MLIAVVFFCYCSVELSATVKRSEPRNEMERSRNPYYYYYYDTGKEILRFVNDALKMEREEN